MLLKKDLTGTKVGDLEVIEEIIVPYEKSNERRKTIRKLKCKCRCGNIFYPFKTNVLGGRTTHCLRCANNKDFFNKKIGNLTVLKRDYSAKDRRYLCRCDCGNICSVKTRYLNTGKYPQKCEKCRYPGKFSNKEKLTRKEFAIKNNYQKFLKNKELLIGQKFKYIKVIKFLYWKLEGKRRRPMYLCKCKCGKICTIRGDYVKIGSCGCAHLKNIKRGVENVNSMFSLEDIKAIKELLSSKVYNQKEIAKMWKAHPVTISKIVNQKSYID